MYRQRVTRGEVQSKNLTQLALTFVALLGLSALINDGQAQKSGNVFSPIIPKTWDDEAIATLEVPLANPVGSPKHVPAEYYYRIPVRPIYQGYPVYAPGHEPPDYMNWLKQQEPTIVWDDRGHAPPLESDADWIRAGEIVFDAPVGFSNAATNFRIEDVRNPIWYEKTGTPKAKD